MTIAQVSEKYNISADTLRYYEKIGLIPPVNRRESGVRDYTEQGCNWVEFIKCMRAAGLSIETLTEYVSLFSKGDKSLKQQKNLLLKERELLKFRIQSQQAVLKRLNKKIELYEKNLVNYEKKLLKKD